MKIILISVGILIALAILYWAINAFLAGIQPAPIQG
jgi:hypothetical protein